MATREMMENLTVIELRKLAREKGVTLGAGISKKGIIDKLAENEAAQMRTAERTELPKMQQTSDQEDSVAQETAPAVREQPRRGVIVTDDEAAEEDDIPVLKSNIPLFSYESVSPPVVIQPAARPAVSQAAPLQPFAQSASGTSASQASSLQPAVPRSSAARPSAPQAPSAANTAPMTPPAKTPSNKPVFTLEGVRAWHNPRSYNAQSGGSTPSQRLGTSQWQRPQQPRQPRAGGYQPTERFGPDVTQDAQASEQEAYTPARQTGSIYSQQPSQSAVLQTPYQPVQPQQIYQPAQAQQGSYQQRRDTALPARDLSTAASALPDMLAAGDVRDGAGVLELHPDGYGFLRAGNYLPSRSDVYVSSAQIRRFNLRNGDYIAGKTRPQRENDRYCALLYITEINGTVPEDLGSRINFDEMTPVYPNRRICLSENGELPLRLMDLLAPIGFGQRALVLTQPKADKAGLLKVLANAISRSAPGASLMTLLFCELPEKVTELRESIPGEVIYATFDEPSENQIRLSELALERAMRLTEQKKDVIVLLDCITTLAKAYNTVAPQSARTMNGGLAAGAMNKPKRFFGSARNMRQGGSLTVVAFISADSGNPLDEAILEELRGTNNTEWTLGHAADKRMEPGLLLQSCQTTNDRLMLSEKEQACALAIRDILRDENNLPSFLSLLEKTKDNDDLCKNLPEWTEVLRSCNTEEKEGESV